MAFTLGFHIILASLGVALPAMMLIANYRGLRRDDADALQLAQRWSKAVAVTFAVGAVTGTVLSFEFGLLWPAFTGRFGRSSACCSRSRASSSSSRRSSSPIYIFGWKRLSPWAHFWTGVPVVITGLGGAFSVVAVNSWMNQPQGFSPTTGDGHLGRPVEGDLQPGGALRGAAHDPGGVPRHRVPASPSIYAVGMLRGRRDRIHRLGLLIPLTVACIATPIQFAVGDTAARAIAAGPADQVRRDGVRAADLDRRHRVHLRPVHVERGEGRDRDPRLRLVPRRLEHEHAGDRARLRPGRRPPAGQHDAALGVRHDGRDLLGADRARRSGSGSAGGASGTSRSRAGSCARRPSRASRRSSRSSAAGS